MFNKNSFLNLLLLSSAIFLSINLFLQSCKKEPAEFVSPEPPVVNVPTLQGVTFESGRLIFNSESDFFNAIFTMGNYENAVSAFERQFDGFISSKSAYRKAVREESISSVSDLPEYMTPVVMEDGETYVRPSVDFHLIAHLANPQGILQIGNFVYKYTYENVYKTSVANIALLQNIGNLSNSPAIEVLPISRKSEEIVVDRLELIECQWYYDNSKRKFHGEIKSRIYPGYDELSVDFDHYKKTLGVWFLNDAPSMSFSGTINGGCCPVGTTGTYSCCSTVGGNACSMNTTTTTCIYSANASGTNEGEIFDVIRSGDGGDPYSIAAPTNIKFIGKGDDNVTRNCSTIL